MSRVDLATDDQQTVAVGVEPHDVKYDEAGGVLYVADEAGRALLTLDPNNLTVVDSVELPARPHDLAISPDGVWVTLVGSNDLAFVSDGSVELVATPGTPHDLIVANDGRVWFSNWNSDELMVLDPADGTTTQAPAGVVEPHHFAIGPDEAVWVTDNGGNTLTGFVSTPPIAVEVGPVPHHVMFAGEVAVVAVSGSGQAVFVRDGAVVASVELSTGLHGVAVVEGAALEG